MFCQNCGKELLEESKFCLNCGTKVLSTEDGNTDTESNISKGDKQKGQEQGGTIGAVRVEMNGIKITPQKIKPIIISTVVIVITILVVFLIYRNVSKNTYTTNLGHITRKMLDGAVIAEELTDITRAVWYNTIYEKSSSKTDKYTKTKKTGYYGDWYDFNSDFNASLRLLSQDPDIISQKSDLKKIREEVNELMKSLKNPPKELQNSYNDLDKLYRVFTLYTELAINPSGTLNSFTSKANDYSSEFLENYNILKIYIK